MTRLYGRSLHGERCYDSAPSGHWESVTILSSLRLNGSTESIVFDGAVDGKMFDEYIKVFLTPTLQPGDIVIADNLRVHKSKNAYDAIKTKQAELIFLPAYSPDMNPIEKMWSKIKQVLRGIKARDNEELFEGIGKALELVSTNDAQGWFEASGYTI